MTVYVWDETRQKVVPKDDVTVPRGTHGIQAIVKRYDHIARCHPGRCKRDESGRVIEGIPGHKGGYDHLGRAVVTSRAGMQSLSDATGVKWDND